MESYLQITGLEDNGVVKINMKKYHYIYKTINLINGILYHKNGSYITFNSLREASNLTGADKSAISKVLRGLANQTAGWSCKKW
jgi:hypothetical protein